MQGTFELKGAPKLSTQTLYLENVQIPEESSNRGIAKSVIQHAKRHGGNVKSCWVFRNSFVRDRVGCKISVPSDEVHKSKNLNIWPKHVVCRDWVPRYQRNRSSNGGSGPRQRQQNHHDRSNWGWYSRKNDVNHGDRYGDNRRRKDNYGDNDYEYDDYYEGDDYGRDYAYQGGSR